MLLWGGSSTVVGRVSTIVGSRVDSLKVEARIRLSYREGSAWFRGSELSSHGAEKEAPDPMWVGGMSDVCRMHVICVSDACQTYVEKEAPDLHSESHTVR